MKFTTLIALVVGASAIRMEDLKKEEVPAGEEDKPEDVAADPTLAKDFIPAGTPPLMPPAGLYLRRGKGSEIPTPTKVGEDIPPVKAGEDLPPVEAGEDLPAPEKAGDVPAFEEGKGWFFYNYYYPYHYTRYYTYCTWC